MNQDIIDNVCAIETGIDIFEIMIDLDTCRFDEDVLDEVFN